VINGVFLMLDPKNLIYPAKAYLNCILRIEDKEMRAFCATIALTALDIEKNRIEANGKENHASPRIPSRTS